MERGKIMKVVLVALLLMSMLVTSAIGCAKSAPSPTAPPKSPTAPSPSPTAVAKPAPSPAPVTKPAPSPAAKPAYKWPSPLAWGGHDIDTAGYIIAAALADAFSRAEGMAVRVVPTGTDAGKLTLLVNKRVQFSFLMAGTFFAQEGLEEFAAIDWGPQPMRYIIGSLANVCVVSAKDANIKTAADLKGKRVSYVKGSPGANANVTAWLAFGKLTWKDVKKVEYSSSSTSHRGILEGTCDAENCLTTTATNYQLAAGPRGLHFIPLPHKDVEGWQRVQKVVPYMVPRVAKEGAGLSETNTVECGGYPNPGLNVLADQDPELVYHQTRLMVTLFPQYSQVKAPGIKGYALDQQVGFKWAVPYHEGAIRYFKEIGVWTADAQKHTDRLIERQKVLKQAWDKAVAESADKKVAAANFPKLWYQIRGQALKAAGFDPYYKGPDFDPWE